MKHLSAHGMQLMRDGKPNKINQNPKKTQNEKAFSTYCPCTFNSHNRGNQAKLETLTKPFGAFLLLA